MVQEYEIVALMLGLITLIVIILNRQRLRQIPAEKILIGAFSLFLASWIFTNLEGIFWRDAFNLLEHVSQTFAGLLITVWCWEVFGKSEERR